MWTEKFDEVISGLCKMYELDPRPVLEGHPVAMGDVGFCLVHDAEADSPLLLVYCDFGAVPQELEAKVYRSLLEANLGAYKGQEEIFCLEPNGRVVFVNNIPLQNLTPDALAAELAMISAYATTWRDGYFLGDEDRPKKKWAGERLLKQREKSEEN